MVIGTRCCMGQTVKCCQMIICNEYFKTEFDVKRLDRCIGKVMK